MRGVVRRAQSRGGDATGAAMVEFALILPVLLVLVLGIINFGYLFGQKLSLNQAVREGARMAVVPGTNNGANVDSTGEIQTIVRNSTGGLVTKANVAVTLSPQNTGCKAMDVGQPLTVRATYPAPLLVPLPVPGVPTSFTLNSEAVFRCEW